MQTKNNYDFIPKDGDGKPKNVWYRVEEEPGIAVAGEDFQFDVPTAAEGEEKAERLAALTDSKVTVVRYTRQEGASFQRKTTVERV